MLYNIPRLQTGLAGILPIAFLHTKLTNKKIDSINHEIALKKATEAIEPEAIIRLRRIDTRYAEYPKLYHDEMEKYQSWYKNQLQDTLNQHITNITNITTN